MSTRQREERRVMIECCTAPVGCRVALRAIVAEVPRHVVRVRRLLELQRMALRTVVTEVARYMIRICRLLKLRRMTLVAIRVMQLVVTIHVT